MILWTWCLLIQTFKTPLSCLPRYGAFEDDVVDMVLVDPSVLINARPLRTPPLRTPLAPSRKPGVAAKAGTVPGATPPLVASPLRDPPGRAGGARAASISPGAVRPPHPSVPPAAHQPQAAEALPLSSTAPAAGIQLQQQQLLRTSGAPQVLQPKMQLDVDLPSTPKQQHQQGPTATSHQQQQQQQQLLHTSSAPQVLQPKMRLDVDLPSVPKQQQQQNLTSSSQQQQQQQHLHGPASPSLSAAAPAGAPSVQQQLLPVQQQQQQLHQSPASLSPSAPQAGSVLRGGNAPQRQLDRLVGPVRPVMPAPSSEVCRNVGKILVCREARILSSPS
ncbi:hypothetical protein DUNSADRAFT_4756 [Dunaliella salina]|uniref:Encoded protein n=1 Tax=Dunaliella salina TaxID=3046 RepID=A0ABQ7FVA5_DUNSA|nr:hypothetical protein DUNSADRAFT_4756 [Dunaliella salina]|eukprot:KAF5826121.1 hypothetical protein DUNSADRAFT_4756 [Dunaliella salina]